MAVCGAGSPLTWPEEEEKYCLEWEGVTCSKCLERKPKPVEKPVKKPAVSALLQHQGGPCYEDTDPMPFGKYRGMMMQDVPASYLFWLWNQRPLSDKKLENYIYNNIHALKQEHPDGIWT
jgi:uncharacterized protein (DUF3820 family)